LVPHHTLIINNTITGPLLKMTEITQKVSAGDLNQQIPIRSHDELATLANAFNAMVIQLRETVQRLEHRAEELRKSEARNRAFLDALPDTIFRISQDGTYLDAR